MDRLSGEGREAPRGPQIWGLGRSWEQGLEAAALSSSGCVLSALRTSQVPWSTAPEMARPLVSPRA